MPAENTIAVGFDLNRQLSVGDPEKRELFISLGCFVESVLLAAEEIGYQGQVSTPSDQAESVVQIVLTKTKPGTTAWSTLIRKRRSDRRFYEPRPLADDVLSELSNLSQGEASLKLFTAETGLKHLSQATHTATFLAMSNPAFRGELASWIRNNWTKRPDGMPAYVQGIPGPISLIAKLVIKNNKGVAKSQANKDSSRIDRSAAIGLICTADQSVAAWLDAGRLYQRACLIAEAHGVKSAGLSAAIVNQETTKQLVDSLNLPATPVALLRFGYAPKTPKASPRLPVSAFVTKN